MDQSAADSWTPPHDSLHVAPPVDQSVELDRFTRVISVRHEQSCYEPDPGPDHCSTARCGSDTHSVHADRLRDQATLEFAPSYT